MPLIISHRANLNGKDTSKENTLPAIKKAISLDFDVEIDIFRVGKQLYLGHDRPKYKISEKFLINNNEKLWMHCKNFDSFEYFDKKHWMNFFWNDTDFHTITSQGFVITHQDQPKTTEDGIIVLKDKPTKKNLPDCYGIITDWPILAKQIYEKAV